MWGIAKEKARQLWREEDGLGMLEIILIIAVIIIIAAIFRTQLSDMVKSLLNSVNSKANDFINNK